MEDMVMNSMSNIKSPMVLASPMLVNVGLISPRDQQADFTHPQYRRNIQAARAYQARRRASHGAAAVKLEANSLLRPEAKKFTVKLNSNVRVASIGAGGGFKRQNDSRCRAREREKLFDTFENLNQSAPGANAAATMTVEEAILAGIVHSDGGAILLPSKKPKHNREPFKNLSPKHPQRLVRALPNLNKNLKMMNLDIKSQQTKSQNPGTSMMNTQSAFNPEPAKSNSPTSHWKVDDTNRKHVPVPLSVYEPTLKMVEPPTGTVDSGHYHA